MVEWSFDNIERLLPKRYKHRRLWKTFIEKFSRCTTYWYIPKARSLTEDSLKTAKDILQLIFDEFLDREWNRETQLILHNKLVEKGIISPTADQKLAANRM